MERTPGDERHQSALTEAWQPHAVWAMQLVRRLADLARHDEPAGAQQLADALADHFDAAVMLTISSAPPSVDAIDDAAHRVHQTVPLAEGRAAILHLLRTADAPAFTALERQWAELVHAACVWVHSSATDTTQLTKLSPREHEAFKHLVGAGSEKEIAAVLGRSRHTIHAYVKRIYRTLGVRSRSELRRRFGSGSHEIADRVITSRHDLDGVK